MKKRELNKSLIILFLLFLLSSYKTDYLILRNFNTGKNLEIFNLKDKKFNVIFTHSVMLSEVKEEYEIRNSSIYLIATRYKDYGAGLPTDVEGQFYIDEDKKELVVFNMNRKIDSLVYRTGSKRANHRIQVSKKEVEFLEFTEEKSPVEIEYLRLNIFKLFKIKREVNKWRKKIKTP